MQRSLTKLKNPHEHHGHGAHGIGNQSLHRLHKFDLEASHQMGGATVRCLGGLHRAERLLETMKGRVVGEQHMLLAL